jgi:hypothetical protein
MGKHLHRNRTLQVINKSKMWRNRDDDDEDDDGGGMFGFRGGSMAMSKKMMADDEVEWVM